MWSMMSSKKLYLPSVNCVLFELFSSKVLSRNSRPTANPRVLGRKPRREGSLG